MNTLLRRLVYLGAGFSADWDRLLAIVRRQKELIDTYAEEVERQRAETERIKIEYSRWGRDIISGFLVILDKPEEQEELRDTLHQALIDMADEVARLEEHAPR